jgi:hypothetical protein
MIGYSSASDFSHISQVSRSQYHAVAVVVEPIVCVWGYSNRKSVAAGDVA